MANHGKRMVKENLIAQIGQASGVTDVKVNGTSVVEDGVASITITEPTITEYAAGTGITFTTESDDTVTISIDTSVVAELTDIPTVTSSITQGSTDAVTSGAVYNAIGDIESLLAAI